MKLINGILTAAGRKPRRVVYQQLELRLPGSRLTREETDFLNEARDLRARLAARRG